VSSENKTLADFRESVLAYDHEKAAALARTALEEEADPVLVAQVLTDALGEVGDAFGRGEIYLPELILASRAGQSATEVIETAMGEVARERETVGTIVLGTVEGDVHDIGKNIVGTLFFAAGFKVVDLGVGVASEAFVQAVIEHEPDLLGMSALLTTTMTRQREVIERLEEEGVRDAVRVLVGGAPVTSAFAEEIGADGFGGNAFEAIQEGKRLLRAAELDLA
jgi:corrinoid protein of di/trimethylamine methyltransferase